MRIFNHSLFLIGCSLLALAACDDSASSGSAGDANLDGTWIQVTGMNGVDERDTFSFSGGKADLGGISTLPNYASNGQIWETFDQDKIYQYSYLIAGDTLQVREYLYNENDTPIPFAPLWAQKFVRLASFTEPAAVDPDLIGDWLQYSENGSSYLDTLHISLQKFDYVRGGSAANPNTIGTAGDLFISYGVIGETENNADQVSYAYRMIGDTLLLNACASSFCSQISEDFRPGLQFLKMP